MKMAVASKKEIENAMNLAGILEDIDRGCYPRHPDGEEQEEEPTWFDEDDHGHLRAFYDRVTACGGLWRVALGYAILTDPRNEVIDPNEDHIALHPRLLEGLKAAESPLTFWVVKVWKGTLALLKEGWNL